MEDDEIRRRFSEGTLVPRGAPRPTTVTRKYRPEIGDLLPGPFVIVDVVGPNMRPDTWDVAVRPLLEEPLPV